MNKEINTNFVYDNSSKEWYLNDNEVNEITNTLDDLQLNVERKINELNTELDKLKEREDDIEALIDCLNMSEPEGDGSEWKAWNEKYNNAFEMRHEITQKINSIESTISYLENVNDSLNKVI